MSMQFPETVAFVMAGSLKSASNNAPLAITHSSFSVLFSHQADPNRAKWTK